MEKVTSLQETSCAVVKSSEWLKKVGLFQFVILEIFSQ